MKTFVIFGDIEFIDEVALVHRVEHAGFYDDAELAETADKQSNDYVVPHYFDGQIVFVKYHKETA